MMQVILLEDVPNLGVVGDLVTVRDGYGRNYLIPQRKAEFASRRSVAELEHQKRRAAHRRKQATAEAELSRRKIEGLSVVMSAKVAPPTVGEDGQAVVEKLQKLHGTVTKNDIANFLVASDVKIDARRVSINEHIRTVGKYVAHVGLNGGVVATLPFWVIPEGAGDVEAEKKRVEAAQESARKDREAALAAEKAAAIAAEKERLRQLEAKKAAEAAEAAKPTEPDAEEE